MSKHPPAFLSNSQKIVEEKRAKKKRDQTFMPGNSIPLRVSTKTQ